MPALLCYIAISASVMLVYREKVVKIVITTDDWRLLIYLSTFPDSNLVLGLYSPTKSAMYVINSVSG